MIKEEGLGGSFLVLCWSDLVDRFTRHARVLVVIDMCLLLGMRVGGGHGRGIVIVDVLFSWGRWK